MREKCTSLVSSLSRGLPNPFSLGQQFLFLRGRNSSTKERKQEEAAHSPQNRYLFLEIEGNGNPYSMWPRRWGNTSAFESVILRRRKKRSKRDVFDIHFADPAEGRDTSPGNAWSLDRGGVSLHEIMSLFCPCRVLLSKESQQAQGEKEEDLRVKCEKNIFFSSVLRVFPFFFFLARLSLLCLPRELSPPPPAFLSTLPPSAHPPESSKGQTLFLSFFQQHIAFQAAFQSETKV